MNSKISFISKIEIKELWNRFDITWNLNPDVNVLSGGNGSGKSTILACVAGMLKDKMPKNIYNLFQYVNIRFDNGKFIHFENFEKIDNTNINYEVIKSNLDNVNLCNIFTIKELHDSLNSTFDNEIQEIGRPDENVRTELDRDIFYLQKKYMDYQLNIGIRAFEKVSKNNDFSQEEVLKIRQQIEYFLETIDKLFKESGKKINREKNEISFLSGKDEITAYQLSSGEKQILVILLTVLVQDNKPSIILMDEPEISLHFDWQKKLIQFIRDLNPNCQIILATHSPAVIIEGWSDKVSNVKDLITNDKIKSNK